MSPRFINRQKTKIGADKRQTVIFKFLEEHDLSLIELTDSSGEAKEDLILMRSHLTENGAKLFEKAIPAWERARDKDGNLSNLDALQNGLKQIINRSH